MDLVQGLPYTGVVCLVPHPLPDGTASGRVRILQGAIPESHKITPLGPFWGCWRGGGCSGEEHGGVVWAEPGEGMWNLDRERGAGRSSPN